MLKSEWAASVTGITQGRLLKESLVELGFLQGRMLWFCDNREAFQAASKMDFGEVLGMLISR